MSVRTMTLLLLLLILGFTEFNFDWMELLVGNYLVTTNTFRPKSGAIWEHDNQIDEARRTLGEYSSQRRDSQLEVRRAGSMGQLLDSMDGQQGAMISADHFIDLFLKLPPAISYEIISPYRLLSKLSEGRWMRTFFEKQGDQVSVYLLDAQNQVVDRIVLAPELLEYVKKGEVAVGMGLDRLSDFAGHIYPADRFFNVLQTLDEDVRNGIISRPEDLLRIHGRIRQVGISKVRYSGMVDLGFELEEIDGPKVILMQGRLDDVLELQRKLEGRSRFGWPALGEEAR